MASESSTKDTLARGVRHGLIWSTINSLVLRLGSLVVGTILARLLAPADFGVYAIALTVQSVLMTLADLGMSVDLIRAKDPEPRAPTVATVSVGCGAALAVLMTLSARPVADAMGAPQAASVIMVLSWTLVVAGAGVVPYAQLQRNFQQRKVLAASLTDFVVGTAVTVGLVVLGLGPIALALGRIAAQISSTSLQFVMTGVRLRFGFDRAVARTAVAYGIPLSLANLLSVALINIDNVVIARVAGATALGLYVLAFNVSTWPMNAIGQAVRNVSLPGFSRLSSDEGDGGFRTALSLTWAAALPAGLLLAVLSRPLIELLYGHRWSASATVLAALGLFGALRVALDLMATFLMARGAARPVLYVQIVWFLGLIPAVIAGTHWKGIAGAGWSHLAVSVALVLPAYVVALRAQGIPVRAVVSAMWLPTIAAIPAWLAARAVLIAVDGPLLELMLGGAAFGGVYVALCYRRIRRLLPERKPRRSQRMRLVEQPQLEAS
jgi:PST family polysaccharide transporter